MILVTVFSRSLSSGEGNSYLRRVKSLESKLKLMSIIWSSILCGEGDCLNLLILFLCYSFYLLFLTVSFSFLFLIGFFVLFGSG